MGKAGFFYAAGLLKVRGFLVWGIQARQTFAFLLNFGSAVWSCISCLPVSGERPKRAHRAQHPCQDNRKPRPEGLASDRSRGYTGSGSAPEDRDNLPGYVAERPTLLYWDRAGRR